MAILFDHTTAGVDFYTVTSSFVTETTVLRVVVPTAPFPVPHRTLFVLPVKPGITTEFGDGVDELMRLNVQNLYNCTLVAPSTPTEPWLGDNPGNAGRRYESFLLELKAWAVANLAAAAQTWAVSFSKGGVSVLHLMLRTPTLFDLGAAWDPPTAQAFRAGADWQMEEAYGTQGNWETAYRPNTLVETATLTPFLATPRLWVSGDLGTHGGVSTSHNVQALAFVQALRAHSVPFGWMTGHVRAHTWTSGWLEDALTWLAAPVAFTDALTLAPRPQQAQLVNLLFPTAATVTNTGLSPNVTSAPLQPGMAFGTDPEVGAILTQTGSNGLDFGPAFLDVDMVDKTIFARLKVTSFGTVRTIVSKEDDEVQGWSLLIAADGHLHYHVTDNVDLVATGPPLPLGTWCTAGVTWDAITREARFYLDGVLTSTQSALPFPTPEGTTLSEPLLVGASRNQTLFPFAGAWANVQIYSGALSAADMLTLHEEGTLAGAGMATQAIAAYGTQLRLSNGVPLAPLAVIFIANTTPITIATSPDHGIPLGDVTWVTISGTGAGIGADGAWVAEAVNTTTLELRGSIWGGTSWVSGGTVTPRGTFTHVAELVNLTPIGISFNMVDCSSHDGDGWGSSLPTFKRGVDMRVELNLVPDHPTHDEVTGFLGLALSKIRRDWLIVLPDVGKTAVAFQAWVSDHGTVTPFDGVLRSNPVLSIDGVMSWAY